MSTLTSCLRKAAGVIDPADKAAIQKRANQLRREGLSVDAAARQAVDERLEMVRGLLARESPASETPASGEAAPVLQQTNDTAVAPASRLEQIREKRAAETSIQDLGEKIGGARKDLAESGGARRVKQADDDRPAWARRFKVSQIVRAAGQINAVRDEGRWVIRDSRSVDWLKQPKQVGSTFATQEEAEAFIPIAAVGLKHRPVPVGGGKYEIWREITDRKRVKVVDQQFDTRDEAMRYMAENAVAIIETNTTFGEADIPLPPNRSRTGPSRRAGNVDGNDFIRTFNLRGVEFGNWNNQDERQNLMNEAWDGLMDLADVLGVPPKALGLGGDLALAFGARGHGLHSARAHYEHERAVINLTKEKGAGTLAHEWLHAMDHYFGRQDGKAAAEWVVNKDGTRTLKAAGAELDMVSAGFRGDRSGVRPELRAAFNKVMQTIAKKAEGYVTDSVQADKWVGRARDEVAEAFKRLRADLAEQKDVRYYKRFNKPANAELLAEFDAISARAIEGEASVLATDWRIVQDGKAKAASRWTNDTLERLSAIYKEVRGRGGFNAEKTGWMDRLRGLMSAYEQRLKMLAEAQAGTEKQRFTPTQFAMDAKELDQGRGEDYWTTPHELAARAFQAYVEDKIAEKGNVSRFLNYAPETAMLPTPWGFKRVYPAGQERQAINAAFDEFVKALKVKEEGGRTVLFSRRGDQPVDLPPAAIGGSLGRVNSHPDYEAAKAGNREAALRLAQDLVSEGFVAEVQQLLGDAQAVIVPVSSIEAAGRNKIPLAVAHVLGQRLGMEVDGDIVQSTKAQRTGKDGLERLFSSPEFDGTVEPGANYLLVDDTLTQGGTFAALASHIRESGGNVLGVAALSGKRYSAGLSLPRELLEQVRERFQDVEADFRAATGYGFDALTESEARYLVKHDDYVAVRDRIAAAGEQARQRLDEGAAQQELSRDAKRWRDRGENAEGPEFYGNEFSLIAFRRLNTQDEFAEDALPLGHAAHVREGNTAHHFVALDDKGDAIAEGDIEVDADGNIEAIHDIEVYGKKAGTGERIVSAILANAPGPVRIVQIVDQADGFWRKMGAGYKDTYGNATADWGSYREARQDARGGQGASARAAQGLEADPRADGQDQGRGQPGQVGKAKTKRLGLRELLEGSSGKGIPIRLAEAYAKAYEAAGLQRVNVARNINELPADLKARLSSAGDDVRGAYFPHSDEIWVFSDNLNTPDELAFVVLHEAFHRGVGELLGGNARRVMGQMYATNQKLRERADKVARELKVDRDTAIEEALADMAGEGETKSLRGWAKLVRLIRQWLGRAMSALGVQLQVSDAQIESFVAAMARAGIARNSEQRAIADGLSQADLDALRGEAETTPARASLSASMAGINQQTIRNTVADLLGSAGKQVSWWDRTLGTQYAKAKKHPEFAKVFEGVQQYLQDTSAMAAEAADKAQAILPRLDSVRDVFNAAKRGLSTEDQRAVSAPVFEGTLEWVREAGKLVRVDEARQRGDAMSTDEKAARLQADGLVTAAELARWRATPLDVYDGAVNNRYEQHYLSPGVVFTDEELRSLYKLNDRQIEQYRQYRAAVNASLDQVLAADVMRLLGEVPAEFRDMALGDRQQLRTAVDQVLDARIADAATAEARDEAKALQADIADKYARVDELKTRGYAPLMRFGRYLVSIKGDGGQQEYFGLFESAAEANRMARELRALPEYKGRVEQGTMSQEAYKLFSGVPVESLEMFAGAVGAEKSAVFQEYLRLTKNNRSALKRLIKRKGTAGFSDDVTRSLAAFVTSNARLAAGAMNLGKAKEAADAIRAGDVKDEGVKLIEAVQNPVETAGALRGLMFVNFIGGSIASALVNTTQPLMMTLPYLSQWGGGSKAAARLLASARMAAGGKIANKEMAAALKRAEDGGVVSPQEIHHLTAEAMATFGKNPVIKRIAFLWGAPFSIAEQFNRRVTFLAAYETAKGEGIADPFEFAERAVIETQGLYNKGNAPNWARNPVGATALTFKQYSIHYLEWMKRMWNAGEPGSKERKAGQAAVLFALALLLAAGGTEGLPFADDINDLVDTFLQAAGYDTSAKGWKQEFLSKTLGMGDMTADVAMRGLSALPGIPLDVSIRMGMGNLVPGTGLLLRSSTDKSREVLELAGPFGGLVNQAKEAGTKVLAGDVGGALEAAMPVALQNASKGLTMWMNGEARDTRGRKIMETDELDAVMKLMGFQPADVARESAKINIGQRRIQLARVVETQIADRWAQGVRERDSELIAEAREELREWNEANPGSRIAISSSQIRRRVAEMSATRADRFVRSAPRELRETLGMGQ